MERPANLALPVNRQRPGPQKDTNPPVPPSLTSMVIGIGAPAHLHTRGSRPTSARMIGWGALGGAVLLAIAGLTVGTLATGTLTGASPSPLVRPAQTATPPIASTTGHTPVNPTEQVIARAEAGTALAGLAELTVREHEPNIGDARPRFGSALRDTDGNGCDQRNDVLRRDLTGKALRSSSHGCAVLMGILQDPYTGRKIKFKRTPGGHATVRIDHLVSVGDAWTKGARNWTAAKRTAFVTDPLNLQAVSAEVIASKGGADASEWLPEAADYRCTYVARQIAVKRKYGIWVTAAERATIAGVLTGCESQKLPAASMIEPGGSPESKSHTSKPSKSKPAKSQKPAAHPKPANAAN